MKFVILFEDDPKAEPNIRQAVMAAHLSFLEANSEAIEAAGPLSKGSEGPTGGLWLVEADNERDVEHLVRTDPFWPTDLRKSFTILRWNQVFSGGVRRIQPQ
ncbi:MAG: YciI family protein [Hyphomicrobiaceae bacterium]